MTSKSTVDLARKALAALLESEADTHWITVKGTHVQVDGKGDIVSGPAKLKDHWGNKPKWEPKEAPQEKGSAQDWSGKGAWGGPSAPPPVAQEKAPEEKPQAAPQAEAPQAAGKIGGGGKEIEAPRISYMDPHFIDAQKDVKQFKEGANNATGEVEPLEGHYDHRGSGPIQVWQRMDGSHEVISGRHRLAHAKRNGVKELPVQVYREADGFTQEHALAMDAELNIRDGNGSVADYARHFANNPNMSEEEAKGKGLLGRAKGQSGWHIGRNGSEQLRAAHAGKQIKDSHAATIARLAPGDAKAQAMGMKMASEGKSGDDIENMMQAMAVSNRARGIKSDQLEMFGNDDSAIKEMEAAATKASQMRRAITNQVHAVKGAANRPEEARALGVDVSDPEGIKAKVKDLEAQAERWRNWSLHSDLAAQVFGKDMSAPAAQEPEAAPAPAAPEPGADLFGNKAPEAKAPEMMADMFGNQVTVDADKQAPEKKAEDPMAWLDKPQPAKSDGTAEMFGSLFSPGGPSAPPPVGVDDVQGMGRKASIDELNGGQAFGQVGQNLAMKDVATVGMQAKPSNPNYKPPAGFKAPASQEEYDQRLAQANDDHGTHHDAVNKYMDAQGGKLTKNADGDHVAKDPVTGQDVNFGKDETLAKAAAAEHFGGKVRQAIDKREGAKADSHNLRQFSDAYDGAPFGKKEEKGGYPNPTQGALHGDYPDSPEAASQPGEAKPGEAKKRFWQPKGEVPEFHAATGYKFKQMKGLTPEEQKQEAELHQYARDNYEELRDKYLQKGRDTNKNGKSDLAHFDDNGELQSINLNIDEWRDFLPGYTGTNPHVNQTTGHYLSSRLTHEMLHEMKGKGNNKIAVLAGGGGSGKTSAVKNYYNLKDYPIVLDQVTGDLDKANQAFDMADKHGYGSKYIYVDRHPNDAWKDGVIKRAQSLNDKWLKWKEGGMNGPEPAKGRTVPLDVAVHDNFGARQTAHELVKQGRQIDVVDNNHGFGKAKKLEDPQEQLAHFASQNHDVNDVTQRAINDTRELHGSGGISADYATALLGRHPIGDGSLQSAQLPPNAGAGLPNEPGGSPAPGGTGSQGKGVGIGNGAGEAAPEGPSAPPAIQGGPVQATDTGKRAKRSALTKADRATIQAEADRLSHEMSKLTKSDPQYRLLYKKRNHIQTKLLAGGGDAATSASPPALPSASVPAQAPAQDKADFSPGNMKPYDHIPKHFNDSDFYEDPNQIPPEVLKKAQDYLGKVPQGVHDLDDQVGGLDVLGGGEARAKFNALRKKQYDLLQHEGFHPLDYHRAQGVVEDHALTQKIQAIQQRRADPASPYAQLPKDKTPGQMLQAADAELKASGERLAKKIAQERAQAQAGPGTPPAVGELSPEQKAAAVEKWNKNVAIVNKRADQPTVNKKAEKLKAEADAQTQEVATKAAALEKEMRDKGHHDLADQAKAIGDQAKPQTIGGQPIQGNTAGDEYARAKVEQAVREVGSTLFPGQPGIDYQGSAGSGEDRSMRASGVLARNLDDLTTRAAKNAVLDAIRDKHPRFYDYMRGEGKKYWQTHKDVLDSHQAANPQAQAAAPAAQPAQAAPAKPQPPARWKRVQRTPGKFDGASYFKEDGSVDTEKLAKEIKAKGGRWETSSDVRAAYGPLRAALKAAPSRKAAMLALDHVAMTQPAVYSFALSDARQVDMPHHREIAAHYELRNHQPLNRRVGSVLPSKAYADPKPAQESHRPKAIPEPKLVVRLVNWLTMEDA